MASIVSMSACSSGAVEPTPALLTSRVMVASERSTASTRLISWRSLRSATTRSTVRPVSRARGCASASRRSRLRPTRRRSRAPYHGAWKQSYCLLLHEESSVLSTTGDTRSFCKNDTTPNQLTYLHLYEKSSAELSAIAESSAPQGAALDRLRDTPMRRGESRSVAKTAACFVCVAGVSQGWEGCRRA